MIPSTATSIVHIDNKIKQGELSEDDIHYMITKAFYNAQHTNKPLRLYRGIGCDNTVQDPINHFLQGRKHRKFEAPIVYDKNFIEIPVNDLKKILLKLKKK